MTGRLLRRASELVARPGASDEENLALGIFFLLLGFGGVAGLAWGTGYALLGRPLAALIPASFGMLAVIVAGWLLATRRLGRLREMMLVLILFLPALLQLSLGGYVRASAVIVWGFYAPLGALAIYGARIGWLYLLGFLAAVIICAVADPLVASRVAPLPRAAQIALFAFNFTGVAISVMVVLTYFRVQRDQAQARAERLLLNVLPAEIAQRLKRQEYPIADRFDDVSVLFADMVGFTQRSALEPPEATVRILNEFLSAFDGLAQRHGLRPIRTTGDSYLVVGGLPVPRANHAEATANMALDMLEQVDILNRRNGWDVSFRIGMNVGAAMAAVVGFHRFTYDVWSDTVNTASRMESAGVAGRIQVTEAAYQRLAAKFSFEPRGTIEVKGKGLMSTYFLVGRRFEAREPGGLTAATTSS